MDVLHTNTGACGDLFDIDERYDYRRPFEQSLVPEDHAFVASLVETSAFQRLKGVAFLGAINYGLVPSPNGRRPAIRYTREQHSLGVLRLALTYCEYRIVSPSERRLICAAALLHDIGHPPLSHSIEGVLAEKFGIDHHSATKDIIYGRSPLGREVLNVLRSHRVDVECVAALVAGQMPDFDGFFSGPITFDTIEGISRSHQYLAPPFRAPNPRNVVIAATKRGSEGDQQIVDGFWNRKHDVYSRVVHSEKGILADHASQEALRNRIDAVSMADYFGDDRHLFATLPGLKEVLTSKSMEREVILRFGTPDFYTARKYYVDESWDFFRREDAERYRYTKFRTRTDIVQRCTLPSNDDSQVKQNEELPF